MSISEKWLLPEGIDEILPDEARRLERLRRLLLDLLEAWGYELVMPPLIEFLESLLTGTGKDLDLQTFKITDQLTGRLMGIRADMTPQAARIDAHYLKRSVPTRLCYLGSVLRTRPGAFCGSREPLQLGAELFGHTGYDSDAEILRLALATLRIAGIDEVFVGLGHVGPFRTLVERAGLDREREADLFEAMQRKSHPEVSALLDAWSLGAGDKAMISALVDLHGQVDDVLVRARAVFGGDPDLGGVLDGLSEIARRIRSELAAQCLYVDLSELQGYAYYTGAVFSIFVPGLGHAIANGGRYDHVGSAFGRSRPAVGFSVDLRQLLRHMPPHADGPRGVFAPAADDPGLARLVSELRTRGERVVVGLPGAPGTPADYSCDREIRRGAEGWTIIEG
ncbi:MAG: ATP phosphoribosyltransferase regulatory subunit [Acidiferrobacteraceae bacterium]